MTAPLPSTIAHLDALTATGADGYLIISTFAPANPDAKWRSASFRTDQVDDTAVFATEADTRGLNVYVRHNLVNRPIEPWERGKHADTGAAVALVVDLDVAGPGHKQAQTELSLPPDLDTAMSIVADLPAPSITIHTGGGAHLWYVLDEPEIDEPVPLLETWADRIVEAGRLRGYLVDRPDPSRVLRVAGTHRRKPGIAPNRVTMVDVAGWPIDGLSVRPWCPSGRYGASDLLEALPEPQALLAPPAPRRARRPGEIGPADAVSALSWAEVFDGTGWTFTGMGTVDGTPVELWQRPGATSPYSVKCFPDGPAVAWSDACGLPVGRGQRLNKWRVFVHLHFAGNEHTAASTIRTHARNAA